MSTVRWMTCLAISLAGHLVWLNVTTLAPAREHDQPAVPVVVSSIEAAPVQPEPADPIQSPSPPAPQEESATEEMAERFRPNTESGQDDEQATELDEQTTRETPEQATTEVTEDSATEQVFTPQQKREAIHQYRDQLLVEFQDQWQEVPQLDTLIKNVALVPRIDQCFGVVILAYSFVDHKPGPPFLIFDPQDGSSQKLDAFDFDGYSNRIKDRMLYAQYRTWLDNGRRQHNIDSLMKIIGLVPGPIDHYFSAKQLRALQLAGVTLAQARATEAHYEPNGAGGFNLIVDTVTTKDGRVIPVVDEELKLSVVTNQ